MKINAQINGNILDLEKAEAHHADAVIQGFFGVLGTNVPTPVKTVDVKPTGHKEPVKPIIVEVDATQTVANVKKVVEKINSERTLHTPIGELVADYDKGTRTTTDGRVLYQTKYWCDCGNDGKRYAGEEYEYITCHTFAQKLAIEDADVSGFPNRDSFGNYFIAREPYDMEVD